MSVRLAGGPDGRNLLGFMCATGALVTLARTARTQPPTMRWIVAQGGWRPVLGVDFAESDDEIVNAIYAALQGGDALEFTELGDNLSVEPWRFREVATRAAASSRLSERRYVDFLAAFGCDLPGPRGAAIQDTALRTMSGAGHQHFLKSMRDLAAETTADDLAAALFEPWRYGDRGPTMRWDPVDDRRYALRADDPAKSSSSAPIRTVRGANRLAIESLPMFPVMPRQALVATTAFTRPQPGRAQNTIQWPIWTVDCTAETVGVLLSHAAIMSDPPNRTALAALGVAEIFRSRRLTVGKMRSFSPATALVGHAMLAAD